MSTITTRAGKGSALTHNEVDANFNNLNNDKVETAAIVMKYKTADVAITANDTLTDDADLKTFNLAAGTYILDGALVSADSGSGNSLKFAFQLVSGAISDSLINYGDRNGSLDAQAAYNASNSIIPSGSGVKEIFRIDGFIVVSSAAVLDFQWAQATSNADNLTLYKGSWISFTKIS